MLWRLNFLVIVICFTVNNEYMLYYICVMHTYWFLSVYAMMAILPTWNQHRLLMPIKFLAYAVANAAIFDIPGAAEVVFRPLWFIFGFHDGRFPIMHEWSFRGGLDHWACFVGTLCAYNYPYFETFLNYLDRKSSTWPELSVKRLLRYVIASLSICSLVGWYFAFMQRDKYEYNRLHPYSSPLPIIAFIIIRNIHPKLRSYHLGLLSWLGKITLETYLSQLHIYLQSNAKHLIEYIPGYPLLNFCLATIVYLCISHALFNITLGLSSYLLPQDLRRIGKNIVLAAGIFLASAAAAVVVKLS